MKILALLGFGRWLCRCCSRGWHDGGRIHQAIFNIVSVGAGLNGQAQIFSGKTAIHEFAPRMAAVKERHVPFVPDGANDSVSQRRVHSIAAQQHRTYIKGLYRRLTGIGAGRNNAAAVKRKYLRELLGDRSGDGDQFDRHAGRHIFHG